MTEELSAPADADAEAQDEEPDATFTADQSHFFAESEKNVARDATRKRTPGVEQFPEPDVTGMIKETGAEGKPSKS